MKMLLTMLALVGATYALRKHLVRLLAKLTGTWVGTPSA